MSCDGPVDALLYWLAPSQIEGIATLAFDPPPDAVRRALLVRVDLAGQPGELAALGEPAPPADGTPASESR